MLRDLIDWEKELECPWNVYAIELVVADTCGDETLEAALKREIDVRGPSAATSAYKRWCREAISILGEAPISLEARALGISVLQEMELSTSYVSQMAEAYVQHQSVDDESENDE